MVAGIQDLLTISRLILKCDVHASRSRINFILLIIVSFAFEISSIAIMKVISRFYFSVTSRDFELFLTCLWRSLIVISVVSAMKSLKTYFTEVCALEWRASLVKFLHENCINKAIVAYNAITINRLENMDQRITQDLYRLTADAAKLVADVATAPAVIIFYSYYLWRKVGFIPPVACFVYFLLGSLCTYLQARKLIPRVYLQEMCEGRFRLLHLQFISNIEAIALLGGEHSEWKRMSKSFGHLVEIVRDVINTQLPLYLIVNWFSYFGAIVNYAVVGASVLYVMRKDSIEHGDGDDSLSSSDTASLLAEGSYACLYLISGFSTLLEASQTTSRVLALCTRVCELARSCEVTDASVRAISCEFDALCICPSRKPRASGAQRNMFVKYENHRPLTHVPSKVATFTEGNGGVCEAVERAVFGRRSSRPVSGDNSRCSYMSLAGSDDLQQELVLDTRSSKKSNSVPTMHLFPPSGTMDSGVQLSALSNAHSEHTGAQGTNTHHLQTLLEVDQFSLVLPSFDGSMARTLFGPVSFTVHEGMRLLIVGPSGCGKSSLFKALAGLNSQGDQCTVTYTDNLTEIGATPLRFRCQKSEVMFVPQRGYCFKGSLLENIIYPCDISSGCETSTASVDMHRYHHAVSLSGLSNLAQRLKHESGAMSCGEDNPEDISDSISGGERQRIAIARVLYRNPKMVLLDECTGALDDDAEAEIYSALIESCRTIVSIGHRNTLRTFHTHELRITPSGEFHVTPIL